MGVEVRMSVLLVLLTTHGALAQEPASGEPAAEEPVPEAPASCPPPTCPEPAMDEEDAALLRALLPLLSADEGVQGAEALGLLADPRAEWVLEHSVEHRSADVATAAAWSLGAFPAAFDKLSWWVQDVGRPDGVRIAAAQALGRLGRPAGADAILAALGDRSTDEDLRVGLRAVLAQAFPERLAEADLQVRRNGTPWLMAGGAAGAGYALAATGHFGQSGLEALGGVTGGLGGATLGYVLGRARPMESGQAAFLSSSGMVGLTGGTLIGPMLAPLDSDVPWVTGLVGGLVGYGAGIGLRSRYRGSPEQALGGVAVGAASAALAGSTVGFLDDQRVALPDSASAGFTGLGLLVGTAVGHLSTPVAGTDAHDAGTILLATTYGGFLGLAVPVGSAQRSTLPVMGMSAGGLLAYGLSPVVDLGNDVNLGAATGLAYGATTGLGLGMLATPWGDEAMQRTTTVIGGTAGGVLGGVLAARTPGGVQGDDVVITGLTTGWSAWQVLGWSQALHASSDLDGLKVLVPSVVGGATVVLSPLLDVQAGDSLCATSLGAWGAYLGSVGGELAHTDSNTQLGLALGASDVGLLGGALLMSPAVNASPTVVGMADAGGVVGGSTAALLTALFTDNTDPILVASLVGAGAGAGGGAVLGRALDRRTPGHQGRAGLHLPSLPAGVQLAPAFLPADTDSGVWGARLSVQGW